MEYIVDKRDLKPPRDKNGHFIKGFSGNPSGKTKLSPELRMVKPMQTQELIRIVSKHLRKNFGVLCAEANSDIELEKMDTINAAIVSFLHSAIKKNDFRQMEFLLNRAGLKDTAMDGLAEQHDFSGLDSDTIVKAIKSYKSHKLAEELYNAS